MLQVDLIDNVEQWDLLAGEWDTLVAAGDDDNPFRCRAWWKHFGDGHSLRILTARDNNRLVGIAPLFIDVEHFPFRVRAIRFLGGTEVCSEYLGLLIERGAEEGVVPALFDFLLNDLRREWDVIRWTDIPADSRQLASSRMICQHAACLPFDPAAFQTGLCNCQVRGMFTSMDSRHHAGQNSAGFAASSMIAKTLSLKWPKTHRNSNDAGTSCERSTNVIGPRLDNRAASPIPVSTRSTPKWRATI